MEAQWQAGSNVPDILKNSEIHFIINTPSTQEGRADEVKICSTAIAQKTSCTINLSAAEASVKAIRSLKSLELCHQARHLSIQT